MPLSASQVLEIQPIPPPTLPSPSRATIESLRDKRNHGPFVIAPATYIDPSIISRFRAYIRSIRIDFSAVSSTLPSAFPGLLLCNKADVQQFLDSQILIPVWPVILSMLPDPPIRNYDWFLCNERASSVSDDDSSLPDKVFLKLFRQFDASGVSTLLSDSALIIEVKAPGLVDGCKPTFDNGKAMITDSWITMTSQLRKYARVHKCQHLVLIDERSVFYFLLKRITENEDFDVEFIAASASPASNILPLIDPLTVQEVIAFAAWNALNTTQGPRLKNYSDSTIISGDRFPMFSYQTLYGSPALPAAPSPENLPNRGQSGYKPQELSPEPIKKSADITLHSCYEISLDQSDYNDDDIGLRCSTIFLSHDGTYQGFQNSDDTTTSLPYTICR